MERGFTLWFTGLSGAGKSTLARLIQRLYIAQQGAVTIDGHDIRHVNSNWLRRSIGVVLQENLLFKCSIHDNIALGLPFLARGEVVAAAKAERQTKRGTGQARVGRFQGPTHA